MIDLLNAYSRLECIFDNIESLKMKNKYEEYRVPIKALSDTSGIPIEVLRSDLYSIIEAAPYEYDLAIKDEYVKDLYENDDDTIDKATFKKDLLSGKLDDSELVLFTDDESVVLPLNGEESSIMEHILLEHNRSKKSKSQPFLIKDSYHFTYQDEDKLYDTLYKFRSSIKYNKEVRIRYQGVESIIRPVRLFYDTTDNIYAVIYLEGEGIAAYRIDNIEYIGEGKVFAVPENLEKRLKIMPNVWGLDFNAKPIKVRVRIFATHSNGNVGKSIKKDLIRRTNGKLYEDGKNLIYEDKVYGKDAFLRWILGYGSSVEVEKPESLRREIMGIINNELKRITNMT